MQISIFLKWAHSEEIERQSSPNDDGRHTVIMGL